jgi:hypothetical protein
VDAHGGVEAEAAGPLPGEHVVYGVLIEEPAALEEAEDAALEEGRKGACVVGGEVGGLVEADPPSVSVKTPSRTTRTWHEAIRGQPLAQAWNVSVGTLSLLDRAEPAENVG